ncbi:hypothetical protein [Streptomyces sp. G-G2]|uniref:hypothetical protein n=1 Tax=Streptomyces sp. G-G2 TaxID=3046201 RepID=UPI0024B8EAA2|nr:hypothetical protein [Streptomyces sp. G-G2]MDJ0379583.1 hypothetical protein [Streptomyces sp. G-G2]
MVGLTGCGEEAKPAAQLLQERTCFGVFTRDDLAPFLGDGDDVRVSGASDAELTAARRGVTCTVAAGSNYFQASATRQPLGQSFFWNRETIHPAADPLALGDDAIVYNVGARALVNCRGGTDEFGLEVHVSGDVDKMKPEERRPLFAKLVAKLLDAAKQQSKCRV